MPGNKEQRDEPETGQHRWANNVGGEGGRIKKRTHHFDTGKNRNI